MLVPMMKRSALFRICAIVSAVIFLFS